MMADVQQIDPRSIVVLPPPAFVALDRCTGGWRFTPLWGDGEHDDTDAVERVLSGGVAIPRREVPRFIFDVQALFDRYPTGALPAWSRVLVARAITRRAGACLADVAVIRSASKRRMR